MNRRQFIKSQLAALAVASAAPIARPAFARSAKKTSRELFPTHSLRPEIRSVAVIGAGIAGLAAAYTLKKAGASVSVFEEGAEVGGRMSTSYRDGLVIDNAAQIISSSYQYVPLLLKEIGMQGELQGIPGNFGLLRNGAIHEVALKNPLSFVQNGLFRARELPLLKTLGALPEIIESARITRSGDITRWAAFDAESAIDWSKKHFGVPLSEYFLNPFLGALYFKDLEDVSKATLLSLLGQSTKGSDVFVMKNGIGSLCDKLSLYVDCQLNSKVTRLEANRNQGVNVQTAHETFRADAAILAIPSVGARTLFAGRSQEERDALSTSYTPTIILSVRTSAPWTRARLPRSMNSFWTPRGERDLVYMAFADSTNAFTTSSDDGLLKFILSGPKIDAVWDASDADLLELVTKETAAYLPGLKDAAKPIATARYRWGMPDPGPGRFRKIKAYRESVLDSGSRILLAGDYMSHITTDGAAESGIWAARRLLGY